MERIKQRRHAGVRPYLLGELLVVFVLLRVYDWVRSFESVRQASALHNARDVLAAETDVHLDLEHGANVWLSGHHTTTELLVWWYQYSHICGTMLVLTACYLLAPWLYRASRNALVITNCVGMLVFVVLPVMPPRLLPHAGFIDSVAQAGYGSTHGGPVEAAQFAAMPSLHLAWATWVALVLFAMLRGQRHRYVVFLYPVITTVAVVTTANHYVFDVLAGVALALAAAALCGLQRRRPEPETALVAEPESVVALEST